MSLDSHRGACSGLAVCAHLMACPAERYAAVLDSMGNVTLEGLIMAVRRQSQVGRGQRAGTLHKAALQCQTCSQV